MVDYSFAWGPRRCLGPGLALERGDRRSQSAREGRTRKCEWGRKIRNPACRAIRPQHGQRLTAGVRFLPQPTGPPAGGVTSRRPSASLPRAWPSPAPMAPARSEPRAAAAGAPRTSGSASRRDAQGRTSQTSSLSARAARPWLYRSSISFSNSGVPGLGIRFSGVGSGAGELGAEGVVEGRGGCAPKVSCGFAKGWFGIACFSFILPIYAMRPMVRPTAHRSQSNSSYTETLHALTQTQSASTQWVTKGVKSIRLPLVIRMLWS